jgi:hypothetical protein
MNLICIKQSSLADHLNTGQFVEFNKISPDNKISFSWPVYVEKGQKILFFNINGPA